MEHLTKQQIVLLTLFTTFVTSIATGIVTVSLMDQAPAAATGTVERVIEQTVNQVASNALGSGNSGDSTNTDDQNSASATNAAGTAFAADENPLDTVENVTALAQKSLVRIKLLSDANAGLGATDNSKITGLGVVVSKAGLIVTDKSAIAVEGNYVAVMPDGNSLPVAVLESQNNGDIVFLLAETPTAVASGTPAVTETFTPATLADPAGSDAPALGETVIALSGNDNTAVDEGIIKKINTDASSSPTSYVTSIDDPDMSIGSPLFDLSGNVVGLRTFSLPADSFYPIGLVKSVIPSLNPVS